MNSVTEFGKQLLKTGDLDPVYVALHSASLDEPTLHRLVLAYWCFYHLGLAAKLAEIKNPKKYWEAMMTAAVNAGEPKPYPRGSERRHYRGAQAVASMASLISLYPKGASAAIEGFIQPQGVYAKPVRGLIPAGKYTYNSVSASAMKHRGFGEWIAFKIADMSERVLGYDTDFSDCHLGIYKDPRQGAAVAYLEWQRGGADLNTPKALQVVEDKPWDFPILDTELKATVEHYVKVFKKFTAPGGTPRPVNVQEVETIFCKYKSHLKGHYPMGKDTREIHHGLTGWGDLAQELQRGLPPVQLELL
jgi:hypothetical protein